VVRSGKASQLVVANFEEGWGRVVEDVIWIVFLKPKYVGRTSPGDVVGLLLQ